MFNFLVHLIPVCNIILSIILIYALFLIFPSNIQNKSNIHILYIFYQGLNKCGNFLLLSALHSLFSIWTDPRGTNVEVRRVDLPNWALRTSPKFTTGVKYQFRQGFWPDQRSGNPNHPSPHIYIFKSIMIIIDVFTSAVQS